MSAGVIVAGGGVIGTAIAWQAAARGHDVVLVDPADGQAASLVAAGMLAPSSEALFGEGALLRVNLLALARFGSFAAELEDATGASVGLRREGTLAIAFDPGDYAALKRLTDFRRSAGLDAAELDRQGCRDLEPFLTPDVHGGVLFEGDWSVDNRRYVAALRAATAAAGVRVVRDRVAAVRVDGGERAGGGGSAGGERVRGVRLAGGGDLDAAAVVVAAGSWSGSVGGLPAALRPVVRPVKGQLLRMRHPEGIPPVISHTIRATVRGLDVYLVPRADGEVIVGATSEERGPDLTVTAGGVHDLLRDAISVLPVTSELILAETCVGLRPGTPDNGPLVGGCGLGGLLLATGHYRNGILMSPVTADAVVACLDGEKPAPEWEPFTAERFTAERFTAERFTANGGGGR